MKNTLLKTIVGAALLGFAALTLAAAPPYSAAPMPTAPSPSIDSGKGFYLLGQVGIGKPQIEGQSFSEDWGLAGRLAAGYLWNLNKWKYGAEAGAMKYFNVKVKVLDEDVDYEGYSVDLLAVGKYCLSDQWNIFGKVGVAYVDQKVTNEESGSVNKVRPEAQIGLGYDFNKNLGVSLTYMYIYGDTTGGDTDEEIAIAHPMHAVMAGVEYHFI